MKLEMRYLIERITQHQFKTVSILTRETLKANRHAILVFFLSDWLRCREQFDFIFGIIFSM